VPETRNRWNLGSGVNQNRDTVFPGDRDDIPDRRRLHCQRTSKPDQARRPPGYGRLERVERVVALDDGGAGLDNREVVAVPLRSKDDGFVPGDALQHWIGHRIGFVRRCHESGDREHDPTCRARGNEGGIIPGELGDTVADPRLKER